MMTSVTSDEIRVFLDEMISPNIVPQLAAMNVDALPIRDRNLRGMPDHVLWRRAQEDARAFVTVNYGDFEKLAMRSSSHRGVIMLPGDRSRSEQFNSVVAAANWARTNPNAMDALADMAVYVDEDLKVQARLLRAQNDDNVGALSTSA